MCSPIDLTPGSRGTDKCGVHFPRDATSRSGGGGETVFAHVSDDDEDLSDDTERRQGFWEAMRDTIEQEFDCRMKQHSRKHNAQMKEMEKQFEQKDGEIKTLREELASKDATLKQTVLELDKQTEEKRKLAVTIRSLELKLTGTTNENRELKEELKVIKDDCQGLKRKHRSEIESLENTKAYAASVLEKERAVIRDKDAKLSQSELELTVSREACSQNRQELQKLKDELSLEKASNAQLEKTTKDLQCRNEVLQRELEAKTSALDGIMSASLELTNKVKDVKDQQANVDEESDGRAVDSGINCVGEDDIDNLPPLTMNTLADHVEEITPKWDLVGHSLSVSTSVIQSLRDQPCSPQSKCTQVLEKWLEGDPEFSWIKLFDVLKRQKLNSLMSRMIGQLKPKPQ